MNYTTQSTQSSRGCGPRFGDWAVISGSNEYRGEQCARRLAANGLNLILVGDCPAPLTALANELTREHGVAVKTVAVNPLDPEAESRIEAATWGLNGNFGPVYAGR